MKPPSRCRKRPSFMDMGTDISTSDTEDEEVPSSNSVRKPVREDEDSMEEGISNVEETAVSDSNSSQEQESPRPRIKFRWKSVKTGSNVSLKVVEPNIELIPSPVFTSSVDVDRIRSLSSPVKCSCVWTQDTVEMCGQHCTNRKQRRECSVETCREECNNMVVQRFRRGSIPSIVTTVQDKSSVMVVVTTNLESQHFLGEWTGEVVTGEIVQIMSQAKQYLKDRPCVLDIGNDLFIDSTYKGSVCSLVTHSCSPSAHLQLWQVEGLPCAALYTTKPIEKNGKVTIDYNVSSIKVFGPSKACRCSSKNCRGIIGTSVTISHRDWCCSCKVLLFPGTVMLHPSLSLPVCSPCRETLLTHDWDPEAEVCRCCLNNDSTSISCSSCTAVFCKSCILRLLGDSFLCLASSDSWLCLICDSRPLRKLQLELLPPENTVDITSRYDGGRLRSCGLRSQRHYVRGVRGIGRGLRGRGRGLDGSRYEDVDRIGSLKTRIGDNRVSRVRRNHVARTMGNSIPRMANNSRSRMRSNLPRRMVTIRTLRRGSNIVRRMGRNPTSYMTRRPVPNIVQRMTPMKDNSLSRLDNTLPDVQSPVPSVSDMDDGSFQYNNITSESTLHHSSMPQNPDIVDLSSDDDIEHVSLSHEGLAKLPPCINIVRLDQQESENRYLLGEMTAAGQVLKTAVSKVEKDIREGKTMRSRHGILLEAVKETKWKMIMLEDKLK